MIIHRAIFGSLERFIAILCEQTGGKWDFWISPRQLQLIPMNKECELFTEQVYNTLLLKGFSVSIDKSGDNFNKKIRNAQIDGFNYIGVIGKEEVKNLAVNLRKRDEEKEIGKFSIPELIKLFESHQPLKSRKREESASWEAEVKVVSEERQLETKSLPLRNLLIGSFRSIMSKEKDFQTDHSRTILSKLKDFKRWRIGRLGGTMMDRKSQ